MGLSKQKRTKADTCATYLINKVGYLDYPQALAGGWPVASGVIEGTCRYLVADRMDITDARWSVEGAEAILRRRAVRAMMTLPSTGSSTSTANGIVFTSPATPTA